MRWLLALAALLPAAAAAEPLRLEAARDVDWGYGCGANCSIRNQGRSTLQLTVDKGAATLADAGEHVLRERHPGGGMVQTTRWSFAYRGRARLGATRLTVDLTGDGRCDRVERHEENGAEREITTGCPRLPRKLRVVCARGEVLVDGRARAAWICRSPARPPGTVQPWIFGIGAILDERLSGEPRAEPSYTLRQ
jgi:hypothetical protein